MLIIIFSVIKQPYLEVKSPLRWAVSAITPTHHCVQSHSSTSQLCVPELNPSEPRTV